MSIEYFYKPFLWTSVRTDEYNIFRTITYGGPVLFSAFFFYLAIRSKGKKRLYKLLLLGSSIILFTLAIGLAIYNELYVIPVYNHLPLPIPEY